MNTTMKQIIMKTKLRSYNNEGNNTATNHKMNIKYRTEQWNS